MVARVALANTLAFLENVANAVRVVFLKYAFVSEIYQREKIMNVNKMLNTLKLKHGLDSDKSLSELIGCHKSNITLMRNRNSISMANVLKLSGVFNIKPSVILSFAEDDHHETLFLESLKDQNTKLKSMCKLAAYEISQQWEHHCDKDGLGPINLLDSLNGKRPPILYEHYK